METQEAEEMGGSSPCSTITAAVAVNGSKNSRHALRWALDKFTPEGRVLFRLLYVRPKITMVPTPMGNYIPISKVREEVASAYRKDIEWQTNAMLLPYKKMCNERKVEAEAVVIEADDVAEAISAEIDKFTVSKLVIGISSRNIFTRKIKSCSASSRISECTPSFCTVYVVSKGKLSSLRASTTGTNKSIRDEITSCIDSCSTLSHSSSRRSEWLSSEAASNVSLSPSSSLSSQRNQALKVINQNFVDMRSSSSSSRDKLLRRSPSQHTDEDYTSSVSNISEIHIGNSMVSSYISSQTDLHSWNSDQASSSNDTKNSPVSQNEVKFDFELERLRTELRHLKGMYEIAKNESVDASQQLDELSARHEEEAFRLKEVSIREAMARETARQEKEQREAAEREALVVRECAEREASHRKDIEESIAHEATEKQRLERALACSNKQYKEFTWEEIESATSSFSDQLMIGMGANGVVYKASFRNTTAAVKILHSNEGQGTNQFKQELEILGRIRHPHLLLLLGACDDRGCLVYEYMENGSLEDRLQCKDKSPPLPWHYRYRIAWEVASALVFLHSSKPDPIIHRDLKPANILLDSNFVSKIGDIGLSTLLPSMDTSMSTRYKDTAPVGTFFYIDPEYQRTGQVSLKSDTYALGVVILQLLTGKPPMGITYIVETAMESGSLADVLDSGAGQWPMKETQELALLGLNCAELRRKDRPDLKDQVLPVLEQLKGFADKAWDLAHHVSSVPPGHFICPILQELMDDPCVASDGYSYDRRAIEKWFRMNDKSPMTNLKLASKNLVSNQSLLAAINDWKSRRQRHPYLNLGSDFRKASR